MNITNEHLEEYKGYKDRLDELLKKDPNKPLSAGTGLRLPEALELLKLSFLFKEMYDRLEYHYAKYNRILNRGIFIKKDIPSYANNIFEDINSNTFEMLCNLPLNQKLKVADKMKINSTMFVKWEYYDEYFDRLFGIMKLFIDYNKNPRKYVDKFVGFEGEILSTERLQFCTPAVDIYDKSIVYYDITKVINSKKVEGTECVYKDFEVYKTEVSYINELMREKIEQVYPELFI